MPVAAPPHVQPRGLPRGSTLGAQPTYSYGAYSYGVYSYGLVVLPLVPDLHVQPHAAAARRPTAWLSGWHRRHGLRCTQSQPTKAPSNEAITIQAITI